MFEKMSLNDDFSFSDIQKAENQNNFAGTAIIGLQARKCSIDKIE